MNPLFIKGADFFDDIQPEEKPELHFVVVSHLLDNPQIYLDCLANIGNVAMLLPKPRSVCRATLEEMESRFHVILRNRSQLASAEVCAALINDQVNTGRVVLIDIGGYFAQNLAAIEEGLNAQLLGVVEVTENGHQRYEAIGDLPVPVLSLARSPLKGPEDYLTGQSIVYSAEALMRECHQIMQGFNAVVFGYGKIGRSIAKALHAKNINTKIVEIDPVRAIEARSRGFDVLTKEEALPASDVIFCATGRKSLSNHDFNRIKNGAFVFSVTSSDDELDLSRANAGFEVTRVTEHVACYSRLGQFFYLGNHGNAINFIHNAEVGPYIFLVQGEVIKAVEHLCNNSLENRLQELPVAKRKDLARRWLAHFGS